MKFNEIVLSSQGLLGHAPVPLTPIRLWLPSDAVRLTHLDWPGRLHRFHVWQRVRSHHAFAGLFNFDMRHDNTQNKTCVTVAHIPDNPWAGLPWEPEQVDEVTAPCLMIQAFLPREEKPFVMIAYRWLGHVELCAFHHGLLRHIEQGDPTPEGILALWSRMIQSMPVLSSSPLYCMEEDLITLFQAHTQTLQMLPVRRNAQYAFFQRMQTGSNELEC